MLLLLLSVNQLLTTNQSNNTNFYKRASYIDVDRGATEEGCEQWIRNENRNRVAWKFFNDMIVSNRLDCRQRHNKQNWCNTSVLRWRFEDAVAVRHYSSETLFQPFIRLESCANHKHVVTFLLICSKITVITVRRTIVPMVRLWFDVNTHV